MRVDDRTGKHEMESRITRANIRIEVGGVGDPRGGCALLFAWFSAFTQISHSLGDNQRQENRNQLQIPMSTNSCRSSGAQNVFGFLPLWMTLNLAGLPQSASHLQAKYDIRICNFISFPSQSKASNFNLIKGVRAQRLTTSTGN